MTHQAKRPYAGSQPHITSYFPPSSPHQQYDISQPNTPAAGTALYEVHLPPAVQSSLLNVGMRVRKAVPEGYKTGSSFSAFTLFADSAMTSSQTQTHSQTTQTERQEIGKQEPRFPKTRPRAGARELTPFCGILKVGGLAQQQWGIYAPKHFGMDADGVGDMDMSDDSNEEGDVPFLSSQSSTYTTNSEGGEVRTPGGNKRRFFEDEDEGVVFDGAFGDGKGFHFNLGVGDRVLAVPRGKR